MAAFLTERYPELKEYADVFDIYRKNRHESLYGIDYRPLEDDAKTGIEFARDLLDIVKNIIEKEEINESIINQE